MFPFLKEKNVKIRFLFGNQTENRKRMSWGDLNTIEMIQDGQVSSVRLTALAARFMVDEKGAYIPHDRAIRTLENLNQDDIESVLKQFTEAMQAAAVPPTSGNPSPLPSEVGQVKDSQPG